jgi:hypothetical protein
MVISLYPDSGGSYLQKYEIFRENHSFFPHKWGNFRQSVPFAGGNVPREDPYTV